MYAHYKLQISVYLNTDADPSPNLPIKLFNTFIKK